MHALHRIDGSWKFGWGLGFLVYNEGRILIGHGGGVPGHSTDFTIDPANRIGVITLANASDIPVYPDGPESVSKRIFERIVPAIEKFLDNQKKAPEPDASWSVYLGKYEDRQGRWVVMMSQGRLVMVRPSNPAPDGGFVLVPENEAHTFRITGDYAYSAIEENLVFEVDERGQVIALKYPGHRFERVANW